MSKILMYSTAICPYCVAAKNFLVGRGLGYEEVRVDRDRSAFDTMLSRSGGRRSVPQIFINDRHVGGYDELMQLHRNGELDSWLTTTP
ncbi:MAG: glutaredoxin 3 [Rhodanobacteraceae bacterium]|nr:glutaredoxin 3 [Rhodanobacteraceae bacterium]MBL0041206.1 glutaredoxin 3 [Xanthomonadales bacterium]MBP6077958.1 glutaredoxin 3 [Xanthomonadales bacterium]MBP7623057.1 glutaredoxin 3 [Xanthomonadales bacterium]